MKKRTRDKTTLILIDLMRGPGQFASAFLFSFRRRKMIVTDVETTGLDTHNCAVISIGAVFLLSPKEQFYVECQPFRGAGISDSALEVNGVSRMELFSPERLTQFNAFSQYSEWTKQFAPKILAGMNPRFDYEFLRLMGARVNQTLFFSHRTFDLHTLCLTTKMRGKIDEDCDLKMNTNKILNYVGLPDEEEPHNALNGAKLETEAIHRLLYGLPVLEDYFQYPVPSYLPGCY